MTPRHVIVLGAARSGTKMMRDALAEATGAGKVPYDVGFVWRRGNEAHPDDAISPASVDEHSLRFIHRFIDGYADGSPISVIEKTVGNTMRIPVVAKAFPDAVYIHLIRDGVDVIESTRRQWTAPTRLGYILAKTRHFPLRMIPDHGLRYLLSLARRSVSKDGRVASWGPRYPGIDEDLRSQSLLVVCARQWGRAVTASSSELARLGLVSIDVRYERLVQDPVAELRRIAEFAGLEIIEDAMGEFAAGIKLDRQGIGRANLTAEELAVVDAEVGDLLSQLSYDRPGQRATSSQDVKDADNG